MKFIESYKQNIFELRTLSKITSFFIAFIAFWEIGYNMWKYFYILVTPMAQRCSIVGFSVGFQILIAIFFLSRFIFLSPKNKKFIWLSQLSWLLGLLSIYAYQFATQKYIFGSFLTGNNSFCINEYYYLEFFVIASPLMTFTLIFYFILSPIKQLLTLIYTFFNNQFGSNSKSLR
jgi:hypothetical protein